MEIDLINPAVIENLDSYRQQFEAAKPFKHLLVDGFLLPGFANSLLRDFPPFDPKKAMNEFGEVGGKAVVEEIESISPAYAHLSQLLKSAPFLQMMSHLTGISDLLPDPKMYGGGTHENLHGQELDTHVDFNYDPPTKLHRRLNLLVYLNTEWREEWGGSIELHSNPRHPDEDQIRSFTPEFNRAVIFETNEHSWHGFPRINLPVDKRHLSRKNLSIYLYTRTRPPHEIVPEHGTFYVQRPLPPHLRPGYVLTADDMQELKSLLARRDSWLERYQRAEITTSSQMGDLHQRIREQRELIERGQG